MSDQIKLAEAMGWKPRPPSETQYESYTWASPCWKDGKRLVPHPKSGPSFCFEWQLPDPFTDASYDYAVLEWARNSWLTRNPPHPDHPEWDKFCDAIWEIPTLHGCLLFYKVGDYARAALKALP